MEHAAEGALQSYLDDELDATEASALERHLVGCTACARELDELRAAGQRFSAAVALLDTAPAPRPAGVPLSLRTRRAWYGPRRVLARAAAVIVALGVSAALLEATTGVVSQLVERVGQALGAPGRPEVVETTPAAPRPETALSHSIAFPPRAGTARVYVEDAAPGVTLRIRLHDGADVLVAVRGDSSPAWRTGPGSLAVPATDAQLVEIALPRSLDLAQVDVNGVRYLTKEGEDLRWAVTPADTVDAVLEWTLPRR